MRVAHVTALARREGGTESHVLALAAAQAARGDDVTIVHAHGESASIPGVRALRATAAVLGELAADVVHVHGRPLAAEAEEAFAAGHPVVRSLHDFSFGCATGEHWFRGGAPCTRAHGPGCLAAIATRGCAHRLDIRRSLARYAAVGRELPLVRAADEVVVYSDVVRSAALANGIDPARCHVVPYFAARAERPVPLPPGRGIVFAGRIVGAKGLDLALRALALDPGAWDELVVAGDGWDRPRCERLAASLGIGSQVRFTGWQDAAGLDRTLRAARLVVLPSRWPEPFGIAGIEALALGRPVVGARVGGIPEWLEDGVGGFLFEPGDAGSLAAAIERTLADETLGESAWHAAARFSPAAHLAALDAVYAAAAGARKARAAA